MSPVPELCKLQNRPSGCFERHPPLLSRGALPQSALAYDQALAFSSFFKAFIAAIPEIRRMSPFLGRATEGGMMRRYYVQQKLRQNSPNRRSARYGVIRAKTANWCVIKTKIPR